MKDETTSTITLPTLTELSTVQNGVVEALVNDLLVTLGTSFKGAVLRVLKLTSNDDGSASTHLLIHSAGIISDDELAEAVNLITARFAASRLFLLRVTELLIATDADSEALRKVLAVETVLEEQMGRFFIKTVNAIKSSDLRWMEYMGFHLVDDSPS